MHRFILFKYKCGIEKIVNYKLMKDEELRAMLCDIQFKINLSQTQVNKNYSEMM